MDVTHSDSLPMIIVFIVGYFFITIEHYTKINKATVALLMAIICWGIQFASLPLGHEENVAFLKAHLADVSQVVFFLLGALAVVEIINQHRGFDLISDCVNVRSKKKMLWIIGGLTFFLSAVLDNLTTTVVMLTLIRRLVSEGEDRLLIGGAIVLAANAGGAWTPIGDVTTTMLWIGGQLSTFKIMKELFLPSVLCFAASCSILSLALQEDFKDQEIHAKEGGVEPLGTLVFFLGIGLLAFVPIFKALSGLPPFMGMLFALSILWFVTDFSHCRFEDREHLRVPQILTKIDFSGVFFFLGILLCVDALHANGLLDHLATFLSEKIGNLAIISLAIGVISAIIDNVPLVAATMRMYGTDVYPKDHPFWNMIAYCAGTGGSILIIGSAAGVVFMGIEKVNFLWYVKRITLPAAAGYFVGFLAYYYLSI